MKTQTKNILKIMQVLTWVVFIGACIKAGALLFSFIFTLFINPEGAKNLYAGLNLSDLYHYNLWYYASLILLTIGLACLRAYILYLVIKIFLKLNFVHPFSQDVASLISKISQVALCIGILNILANAYCNWLVKRNIGLDSIHDHLEGGTEFIFMAGIIFIIAQVFKKGMEIQSENELTV
jgi:Protein of unknown function (DUF2975)